MSGATPKTEIEVIDGTPKKRVFLSIISDYDLQTGLCELIDNALDLWTANDRKRQLQISIVLDVDRQLISVADNAGGVKQSELELLIAPGASRKMPDKELIGIFGVGGKRAGVALGESVEIRTRYKREKSIQLDINNAWLESENWHLAAYEISEIAPSTTTVDISMLRQSFDVEDVKEIRGHLGETYEWFIGQGCLIKLNGDPILSHSFEKWAFPPHFKPRKADFKISPSGSEKLSVRITAGLIRDRDAEAENYGVYFYCNHRLVVKELRSREVGYFITSEAGVPHPDASLCRVIVRLQGAADLMPWNSSKSGINFSHPAFLQVRPTLIQLCSYFSSLSRRLKKDWDRQVFQYARGAMEVVEPSEILENKKIVLPKLPRSHKPPYIQQLKSRNKKILNQKPWTLGLIESMALVNLIEKQKLDTKNRAALVLLDSNFEIAIKEFIVNRRDIFPAREYTDAKILHIFGARHRVLNEIAPHVSLTTTLLGKVNYYYTLRNKLIHERATVGITDTQIDDYRKTVEQVLDLLFNLKFPRS